MGLRDIESSLPPGFRFHPSDEELVCHYLYKKVSNEEVDKSTFMEINLHTCEPWQLPEGAKLNSKEWYFFSFRDRKYATGSRANRATTTGYWKATGKDRFVYSPTTHMVVGMRKTLVFYQNRAPNGIKTDWIMHEFRLENPHAPPKEDWVLCRVFQKGKGENNYQLSPQNEFQSSTSPPTNPTFPCNYQSQISSTLQDSSAANLDFLPLSGQRIDAPVGATNSMHDDDFNFFFDIDFEERNIGNVVPTNFGEIIRYGDDNSMVFH